MARLAIIGFGSRISSIYDLLRQLDQQVELVAVADPNAEQVRTRLSQLGLAQDRTQMFESADKMLESTDRYDGVMIGTRCHLHAPMAIKVAATGLPLFLEKPVAINSEQHEALSRAFRGKENRVVVSFPLRCTPLFAAALEVVRSGRLGKIDQIQAINNVTYGGVYFGQWYRNFDEVGGLWLQKATHDFDYINLLTGSRPTAIAAMTTQRVYGGDKSHELRCSQCDETETCMESPLNIAKRGDDGGVAGTVVKNADHLCVYSREIKNEDAGSALIRYDNGVNVSYSQNFVTRRKAAGRRGAIVTGYSGTLEFDWYTDTLKIVDHHRDRVDEICIKASTGHGGGDHVLAQNFLDLVAGKGSSKSSLKDGLLSVAMCLAARTSSETHTFQSLMMPN